MGGGQTGFEKCGAQRLDHVRTARDKKKKNGGMWRTADQITGDKSEVGVKGKRKRAVEIEGDCYSDDRGNEAQASYIHRTTASQTDGRS
ncbi:hypothetical protein MRX96_058564 [Rhipicephalus microplus]